MFRKAERKDCQSVYALICDMERRELPYEPFREIFQGQLDDERYCCLLDERDGRVAGMLNLRFEEQLHHASRIAEILEFVVDPALRDRGIGKRLLGEARRIAAERGCVQLEVDCNQLRTDTHRFYLREGMQNCHYKFSESLTGEDAAENRIGR